MYFVNVNSSVEKLNPREGKMRKIIPILVVTVLYLTIASTSLAAEWTIMVYCAADNNLDLAGVEDLNELEYSGSTDSVNFIFLLDRYG